MTVLVLLFLVLIGLLQGLQVYSPAAKTLVIARLAPVALFFLWAPANVLGMLSAALLTTAAYAFGSNLGSGAQNLLVDREPWIGAWIHTRYGNRASMFWMAGAILVGTILYLIA